MADRVGLHDALGLVDPVDDPVGAAASWVVSVKRLVGRLAHPARVDGDRVLDGSVAAIATSSGRLSLRLRRACRESRTVYGLGFPRGLRRLARRRRASARRTVSALKLSKTSSTVNVSPTEKSSLDWRRSARAASSESRSSVSCIDSYSATEISITSARPLRVIVKRPSARGTPRRATTSLHRPGSSRRPATECPAVRSANPAPAPGRPATARSPRCSRTRGRSPPGRCPGT